MDKTKQGWIATYYTRLLSEIENLWMLFCDGNDATSVLVCLEKIEKIILNLKKLYKAELPRNIAEKKNQGFDYFFRGWE